MHVELQQISVARFMFSFYCFNSQSGNIGGSSLCLTLGKAHYKTEPLLVFISFNKESGHRLILVDSIVAHHMLSSLCN